MMMMMMNIISSSVIDNRNWQTNELKQKARSTQITCNWQENIDKQRKIESELHGADDGFCVTGAFSELYVNTGFPRLYSWGPATHRNESD